MLTAGMTKRFGGMMASMENTWQGVTSSIKDIWRMTVGTLTQNLFGGLNAILIKVRDFLAQFYSMLQAVMGKKAQQTTDGLVESTKGQAAAMSDVGEATEEAAKKAKKNIQGFDEIHQLQEEMSDTAAGDMFAMPGVESPVSQLETEDAGEPEAFTKMEETLERLKELFNPVVEGFNRLKEAAEPIIQNIGEGLKWFYENVLVPFGKWVISEALPAWLDMFAASLSTLNPIIDAFKSLASWLWENFLQPIANWAGDAYITWLNTLADAYKSIGDWMSENMGVIEAIAIVVGSFAAAWGLVNLAIGIWNVIGAIAAGVTTAFGAAVAFLTSPIFLIVAAIAAVIAIVVLLIKHWDEVKAAAIACWEWIKQTWQVVAEWFDTNIIQPLVNFFTGLWDGIKQLASDVWSGIVEIWQTVSEWFDTKVIQPVAKFFAGLWDGIKEAASNAWDGIVEAWNGATSWIDTNIIQPIAQFFKDLWEGIKEVWNKAAGWFYTHVIQPIVEIFEQFKENITGIWDSIWSGIKSVINFIIRGLNFLIKGLNAISFSVPDWIPVIGGKSFGFNIAPIPELATGTNYVPQDMLAMLHEGEAVVPKKYNPAAAGLTAETIEQAVYRAFVNALRIMQASAKQDDKELVLKIDNTTLARMQLPAIIREGQRQGLNLVVQPQGV